MLAIAGGKGGCGKTTTTLGLAGALARRGYDPLVVDGDCDMPDVHHRLGMGRTAGVDALADGAALTEATVISEALPGVALVTGGRRDALGTALRQATGWHGPVLVDCSAGTSRDALRPLRHADRAVVVSTDQPQCIEDAALTRTVARRLSAAVAGVVVRNTARDSGGTVSSTVDTRAELTDVPAGWQVLGEVPHVEGPLADPRARRAFQNLSTSLYPAETNRQATKERTNSHAGGNGQNQQRYCRRNI